jgi:diguanylate cyclase (GGDEF)-like protein
VSSLPALPKPAPTGFDLEEADIPTARTQLLDPGQRDRGVLVETGGLYAGRPHTLGARTTIGRSADCLLRIDDEALSRLHARITYEGNEWVLEDLGSTNGCFVGDERVSRVVLRDGDRVRFGFAFSTRFQVVTEEERRSLVHVYEAGLRDPLTGAANRKQLEEQLHAEMSFARRHGAELSVVMVDVDRFKSVNDRYGHLVGDAVLKHVARTLTSTVRTEDLVARFGGEEFVVVARATSQVGAGQLAERLRAAIERAPLVLDGYVVSVTASFGVASYRAEGTPSLTTLLGKADERLYRAKVTGRNRVISND